MTALDYVIRVKDPQFVCSVLSALLLARVVYRLVLYPYVFSPLRKIPGPSGSLKSWKYVLFGEFPEIMRAEAGVLQREWAKLYGTVVRAVGPFGIERVIFLSPNAMQKVLVSDWLQYPRPDFLRNVLGITAGYGLLTTTGDEHRMMRRSMNPAFSIASLTAQTEMFYGPIYGLVALMKERMNTEKLSGPYEKLEGNKSDRTEGIFLMYEWLSKATLDIICLTAFGYKSDSLHDPHNELAEAYHDLLNLQNGKNVSSIIAFLSIPGIIPLARSEWTYNHRNIFEKLGPLKPMSTLLHAMHRIRKVSIEILQEKITDAAEIASNDNTLASKKDVMSLLVQARMREPSDSGFNLTDDMMTEQVLTFLGAGHETTASGLAWTLWLLANHPAVQNKLRTEIQPILANEPEPDFRSLKNMVYLDHVVMESLRVFPPVPMTMRRSTKSDYVDGVWIPKGTMFYIAVRVINTYKGFWGDDAEEFRPERWANLAEAPAYHPTHSFQSFIQGPHHCIGKTMAITEMKAVLAILIANFEFAPAFAGQRALPTAAVTMKPADDLPLLVRCL